jgi:hypothetical protein
MITHSRIGIHPIAHSVLEPHGTSMKKTSSKRELIDTGRDKRFVRRDSGGKFKESDDVGKSLAVDRRQKAKRTVPAGQGDRGDQKRRK